MKQAREGEHSGVAQKFVKERLSLAIACSTGRSGASGASFQPNGAIVMASIPMSSSTMNRMFGRSAVFGVVVAEIAIYRVVEIPTRVLAISVAMHFIIISVILPAELDFGSCRQIARDCRASRF